jgi:hypothetical protein
MDAHEEERLAGVPQLPPLRGDGAEKQTERARSRHEKARADGTPCIDCHFGIAHQEPDGPGPRELKIAK